jgi:hypothetical protein
MNISFATGCVKNEFPRTPPRYMGEDARAHPGLRLH